MKRLSILFLALLALPFALSFAPPVSQDDGAATTPAAPSLHEGMEVLEKHYKALRRSLRDETKAAESLAQVSALQTAVLECKLLQPPMTDHIPKEEQAAFVTSYRKEMLTLLRRTIDLEEALLDGRFDKTRDLYKKIHDSEESGHETFVEDE